jgi:predicted amidohydrolase
VKALILVVMMSAMMATSACAASMIKVSAVQMRSVADLSKNVEKISGFLESLSAQGVQIAVFPECALTSYNPEIITKTDPAKLAAALDAVGAACKKFNIAVVMGTPVFRPDGKLWNSAIVFGPDGRIIEKYYKIHLAEDWPQPGDHLALFDILGTKATIIICHDERYPELVRLPVIGGARLVFYISSESGITSEGKIIPYRAQIQARAVENCVWVIHSNTPGNEDATGSHGQSRIIKPDGNIVAEGSMFGEDIVTSSIDMDAANGGWAHNSMNCDFLKAFWEAGLKTLKKQ